MPPRSSPPWRKELIEQEAFVAISEKRDVGNVFQGPQIVQGGVRFAIEAPHAQDVRVTGEFTDWSYEGVPLQRGEDGVWSSVIEVGEGAHEYRFILDGVWVKDPNNFESVINEFGQENSVVMVCDGFWVWLWSGGGCGPRFDPATRGVPNAARSAYATFRICIFLEAAGATSRRRLPSDVFAWAS